METNLEKDLKAVTSDFDNQSKREIRLAMERMSYTFTMASRENGHIPTKERYERHARMFEKLALSV